MGLCGGEWEAGWGEGNFDPFICAASPKQSGVQVDLKYFFVVVQHDDRT